MSRSLKFVSLLFPDVTQLDLTGPLQVFSRLPGSELHLVWHREEPVPTDSRFSIVPTATLDEAPQADVLFVPGGQGAFSLFEDQKALSFLRRQAAQAKYVTSVCTGSFALAAAGLLRGKHATSHWGSLQLLEGFGAVPVTQRVVRDGTVITAAGVASGIDFALTLAAELYGSDIARGIQLAIEYDPQPPFDAGSPRRPEADPRQVADTLENVNQHRGPLVKRAIERLNRAQ